MKPTNKLMKRLSLYLFLIFFTLQTPSQADDIQDFQIEGMSLGDSLLDYMSKKEIKENIIEQNYSDDKFKAVFLTSSHRLINSYDAIYINFKLGDKNFIIHGISGIIDFSNSIKKCKQKKNEIVEEIKSIFTNPIIKEDTISHDEDKTGKSKLYRTSFGIEPSSKYLPIDIACFDWTKKMGYADHLRIGIKTDEYNDWLRYEAHK